MTEKTPIRELLYQIYGEKDGAAAFERIASLIDRFPSKPIQKDGFFSEKDVVLITYGDSIKNEGEPPLKTLHRFSNQYFKNIFSTIHFLPFFPYSSDDGFSVKDFFAIDFELGEWEDVSDIGKNFDLMFDMVLNHISAKSKWFSNYLDGKNEYKALAIEVDPTCDLSSVTRPRALPLLTPFKKTSGKTAHVWTTFSDDQIDLNYQSLDVLEKMVSVLLFYVQQGATMIRFDAIAYLWKKIGTSCIHLPQTHAMTKLFRAILDEVAPSAMIVTETNVPHPENISYFGNGRNEAQLVYNFTLPPLLLYTFMIENAEALTRWAKTLTTSSNTTSFFNFTASHDGIGVRPLEGILPDEEIFRLVDLAKKHGAGASMKRNPDGTESPYELNITYVDAILGGAGIDDAHAAAKFMASQAIQYTLPGVPAAYIHSVLGSRNWEEGVLQTSRARSINREKLDINMVDSQLKNPEALRSRIFNSYLHLIKIRKQQPAFHPNALFRILDVHPKIFAIYRETDKQKIWVFTNISSTPVSTPLKDSGLPGDLVNLLTDETHTGDDTQLAPYEYIWLTPAKRK
jgi:glucosylglycerate phosphorylase